MVLLSFQQFTRFHLLLLLGVLVFMILTVSHALIRPHQRSIYILRPTGKRTCRSTQTIMSKNDHVNSEETGHDEQLEDRKQVPRKYHHYTVCMVPPESAVEVWDYCTRVRTELRDPGLFRWPPHANLLYPFQDIRSTEESAPSAVNPSVIEGLLKATQKCEPFSCRLQRFGTFGGAERGVLWLYPESTSFSSSPTTIAATPPDATTKTEPLVHLQSLLVGQFPLCTDQTKVGGKYNPHVTVSHFVNLNEALAAQEQVQKWWPQHLEFTVDRIYLLSRKGDDSQFLRVADIGLGQSGQASVHDHPLPFVQMPTREADWVREERMKLKARRNRKGRRGRRSSSRERASREPDSPEVIAAKRAERKLKKESLILKTQEAADKNPRD